MNRDWVNDWYLLGPWAAIPADGAPLEIEIAGRRLAARREGDDVVVTDAADPTREHPIMTVDEDVFVHLPEVDAPAAPGDA